MSEERGFTVELEHRQGMEFTVRFDWDGVPELLLDEPQPIGGQKGPNASRLLGAAVGNCLTASLLFCLQKSRVDVSGARARVEGELVRNERGRLRIGGLHVKIDVDTPEDQAAKLERCLGLYEDFCLITESVRAGIPVSVEVNGATGD